ncbi:MAG: hypothetical protein FJY56_06860 [Betaproteobacteria bacterium]|nr:hypothetical protein [Betaproteobacteria bacterium]
MNRPLSPLTRATLVEAPDDLDELIEFFHARRWSDGLPIVPPTRERVARMLSCTQRKPDEIIAKVAPGFGEATVERIAINAVMAGCRPDYLPVLIAATQAMSAPEFNLQGIQATTNPVAVWLIINGPIAEQLSVNAGPNCLGQGTVANATLGRALRLIMQNIGGALPGDMDRATHGQPGKFSFCCAENEAQSPWPPLHVERGFKREQSTVTVVGAAGTHNMNTHADNADELLRVIADTMMFPASNDYWIGGEPWLVLGPQHAAILHAGGLSKAEVKRRLWEESKMPARRMAARELQRTQAVRESKIGPINEDTMLAAADGPEGIGILVAGGPGTHSVYVASFGDARAVTREVIA